MYETYCPYCDIYCKNSKGLSYHLSTTHEISRREYVIEMEYNGKTPICDRKGCNKPKFFSFGKFGKFCSAKCRANSPEHLLKSKSTLQKSQAKMTRFKNSHFGMTEYEYALWANKNFSKLGFEPQRIVNLNKLNVFIRKPGHWIRADFLHRERRIIIEVDGERHCPTTDSKRDKKLVQLGYVVLRFTNDQVIYKPNFVLRTIKKQLKI